MLYIKTKKSQALKHRIKPAINPNNILNKIKTKYRKIERKKERKQKARKYKCSIKLVCIKMITRTNSADKRLKCQFFLKSSPISTRKKESF